MFCGSAGSIIIVVMSYLLLIVYLFYCEGTTLCVFMKTNQKAKRVIVPLTLN